MSQNTFSQQFTFLVNFAKQQLTNHKEFYPFASVIEANGELRPLAVHLGVEHPTSKSLLDEFDKVIPLLIRDKSIIAAAVCVNASTVGPDGAAIVIEMENAAGEAATVSVPYTQTVDGPYCRDPEVKPRLPRWFTFEECSPRP